MHSAKKLEIVLLANESSLPWCAEAKAFRNFVPPTLPSENSPISPLDGRGITKGTVIEDPKSEIYVNFTSLTRHRCCGCFRRVVVIVIKLCQSWGVLSLGALEVKTRLNN